MVNVKQNHKSVKEPSRIFESMAIVGLHPDSDVQALQKQFSNKNPDCIKRSRTAMNNLEQLQTGVNLEPQVYISSTTSSTSQMSSFYMQC